MSQRMHWTWLLGVRVLSRGAHVPFQASLLWHYGVLLHGGADALSGELPVDRPEGLPA
jgi:hypothetical protein